MSSYAESISGGSRGAPHLLASIFRPNWDRPPLFQGLYNRTPLPLVLLKTESATSFPGFSPTRSVGRVGENPGNEVAESGP